MEFIPGLTLQQRLDQSGPLDVPTVLRIGRQIAEGLAAAHAQDLIHRDIKPANILLETSAREMVKVTDFGLARAADDASMTQSGTIAGTPMYMAPEQAMGHKLDQRADLFSFGSVLYQTLSGRPPFRAETTVAMLRRVVEDAPRPIQEIIPEVPDWMCELVGHLHAKNPNERFASAREVGELLARCTSDLQAGRMPKIPDPSRKTRTEESPVINVEPIPSRSSEPHRRRSLVTMATAAVILFAALGLTEATGVTHFASTVIRLSTGSGTLVIETDDPGVKIAIDGEEVRIKGAGIEELTLRPGQYKVEATKEGKPVRQELVSISRNGRTAVRMSLEPAAATARPTTVEPPRNKSDVVTHKWPADAPQPAIAPFDAAQARAHQEAWAKHLGLPVEFTNSIGMKFRLIPPGEFLMGSTPEQLEDALKQRGELPPDKPGLLDVYKSAAPQHRVILTQPIYLGMHEVTQHQFEQVIGRNPSTFSATGRSKGFVAGIDTQQFPVEMVSWNDATEFCAKLSERERLTPFDVESREAGAPLTGTGYRLPTEAEWEAACRAGTTTKFRVGDNDRDLLQSDWLEPHSEHRPHPVGELRANPFGLFDVHGNIQELVWDLWEAKYYSQFESAPAIDPLGPTTPGIRRVSRGGRFAADASVAHSSKRGVMRPTEVLTFVGFRVALPVEAVKTAKPQTPMTK